jgi:amino acid adenylation domain-containing protein
VSEQTATLHELFNRTVRRYPNEAALDVGGTTYSYGELSGLVDRLVERLIAAVGETPRRIGLYAARSRHAYVGYLAILRIGAAVVPLNPGHPPNRTELAVQSAGLELILTDRDLPDASALNERVTVYRMPDDVCLSDRRPSEASTRPADERVAYIMLTSGSTGRPKGVPIEHGNVVPFIDYNLQRYQIRPGHRLSQTFDLTFDLSVFDLFVCWSGGATLVVPHRLDLLTPSEYVRNRAITHWFSVPSLVSYAAELGELHPDSMPGLVVSLFCGEQLTTAQYALWSAAAPNSVVENLYGPTELTIACSAYRAPTKAGTAVTSNGTVPIGDVYPYLEAVLLDGERVDEVQGELCVRGVQRFPGYLCEEDNGQRFVRVERDVARPAEAIEGRVPDAAWYRTGDLVRREGGVLVHLGRLDDQVKISGHRVELGEVAGALRAIPGVRDCVVLAKQLPGLGPQLVAAYTGSPETDAGIAEFLRRSLPAYMTPSWFVHLESLPLNANGKVDRSAILAMVDLD